MNELKSKIVDEIISVINKNSDIGFVMVSIHNKPEIEVNKGYYIQNDSRIIPFDLSNRFNLGYFDFLIGEVQILYNSALPKDSIKIISKSVMNNLPENLDALKILKYAK
jgi:hypothetical protein